MDGHPENVVGSVPPGQTYDFYVDLEAPSGVLGVEQGHWQMQNAARVCFGQTVWVMVEVVAPTPTRTVSLQPSPTRTATGTTPPSPTPSPGACGGALFVALFALVASGKRRRWFSQQ